MSVTMYGYIRPHCAISAHEVANASEHLLAEFLCWSPSDWRDDPDWPCVAIGTMSIERVALSELVPQQVALLREADRTDGRRAGRQRRDRPADPRPAGHRERGGFAMSTLAVTRVYVVEPTNGSGERLLRAPNKSRAVRQAVTARIATQADLERLIAAGVVVETQIPKPAPPPRPKIRAQRTTSRSSRHV